MYICEYMHYMLCINNFHVAYICNEHVCFNLATYILYAMTNYLLAKLLYEHYAYKLLCNVASMYNYMLYVYSKS